jgi:hypothetical protein
MTSLEIRIGVLADIIQQAHAAGRFEEARTLAAQYNQLYEQHRKMGRMKDIFIRQQEDEQRRDDTLDQQYLEQLYLEEQKALKSQPKPTKEDELRKKG